MSNTWKIILSCLAVLLVLACVIWVASEVVKIAISVLFALVLLLFYAL